MTDSLEPRPHPLLHVDATRGYVTDGVRALIGRGLAVDRSWLDPADPRDATIVLRDSHALVWDEMTGWRVGLFRSGEPGVRTVVDAAVHLGGGPLPTPAELAGRLASGVTAPARAYRSYTDSDGLDAALRAY